MCLQASKKIKKRLKEIGARLKEARKFIKALF
jgi:hypothetical protein